MRIKYADGRTVEIGTLEEAAEIIDAEYQEAVYCSNGSISLSPNASELRGAGRILVWADEASSENDAGQKAVAEIVA